MLKLSIVTPEKKLLTDVEVATLTVPTEGGEIEILEGHTALMSTLSPGTLRYTLKNNESNLVVVSWGYCEVFENSINVLAETAERPEEIDIVRVEARLKEIEQNLATSGLTPLQIEELTWKKEKAMARAAVAKNTH